MHGYRLVDDVFHIKERGSRMNQEETGETKSFLCLSVKGDDPFEGSLRGKKFQSVDSGQDLIQAIDHEYSPLFRLSDYQFRKFLVHRQVRVEEIEFLKTCARSILNSLMDFVIKSIAKKERDVVGGKRKSGSL